MNSTAAVGETPEKIVIWLHGDHLRADNPALARYPDAPVVFVFDEPFLRESQFAFHRLFFLYEAVMEIFATRKGVCSVRRGDVVDEVSAFAQEQGATRLVTTQTLGDRFTGYVAAIGRTVPVVAVPVPSLVPYDAANVPRRFSAWWREVEKTAMQE
jgi:hypothetical protein